MQKFLDSTISNVILRIDYIHFNVSGGSFQIKCTRHRVCEVGPPSGWLVTNIPEVGACNQDSEKGRVIVIVPLYILLQCR